MLGMKDQFIPYMESMGIDAYCANVVQTLSEQELIELVPQFDGWIIGDDPATRKVFEAGKAGKLKAAVKWGIGVDNVDFEACKDLAIPIINTPNMFGAEVADVALGYVIALARQTFFIDREIRAGAWPKNRGMSLLGKTVGVIGFGDIGKSFAKRAVALGMKPIIYDPGFKEVDANLGVLGAWPNQTNECDFLVFTCALNKHNYHMLNADVLSKCKDKIRIVNVARGPLIDEQALCEGLKTGKVHSVALDVFEIEPLPMDSYLREHSLCVLGSHNSSNTEDAVIKTNIRAIDEIAVFFGLLK
jgi:D-3-phosphoglycerate dehydrogenase